MSLKRDTRMDTKRSVVWKYFADLRKVDGSNLVECRVCNKKYSHKGNTTNMFHHLKANHPSVYNDILRERQLTLESNTSLATAVTPNSSFDFLTATQPMEMKLEPTFVDADQSDTTECLHANQTTYEPKGTTHQNTNVSHLSEDIDEIMPSTSYSTLPGSSPNCCLNQHRLDEDLSTKMSVLSSEMRDVKEIVGKNARPGDHHFFNSISSEFESMDDDSRDLLKVAIWQIIYKVKCARKRNMELSLNELVK